MVSRLRTQDRVEFSTLFSPESSRGLIIATFCGMLEMIKLRIIAVEQDASDEPIYVRLVEKDVDDAILRLVETYGHGEFHGDLAQGVAAPAGDADGAGDAAEPGASADAPETT
jgi:hypothetical protein